MSEIYQDADAEGLEGPSWWWPMRLYEGYGCHLRLSNQRNSQEQKTIPAIKTAVDDRAETKTETLDSNKRGSAREEESQVRNEAKCYGREKETRKKRSRRNRSRAFNDDRRVQP
ncbi:hypothetical protein ACFX13_014443 [Malus domestica]